ncbi:MAG: ESX-1 secretion-associated protein [Mycobacteriaceae bacterium]|nr:ESX-1 secretion-associated protein [Mycobacteriaceae bacterium]
MADVSADPDYIKSVAPYHEQAADVFGLAASTVNGSADKISASHGAICNASKDALKGVEEAHNRLAAAMQQYSTDLAASLRTAADAYQDTDDFAAKHFNRQLR